MMARDREIACKYYECEGKCVKGREGTFYHYCQKCDKYDPIKHRRRQKKNLKKEKLEKIKMKEDSVFRI